MRKFSLGDIANPMETLAEIVGPEAAKIIGAGLTMGTAAEMIAMVVAPQIAMGVAAVGMLSGMVLQYLRGRKQKKMAEAMANDGLIPEGPAFVCGERGQAEFQAIQQQTMANGR